MSEVLDVAQQTMRLFCNMGWAPSTGRIVVVGDSDSLIHTVSLVTCDLLFGQQCVAEEQ